ncbi:hypothetical protein B0T20DRAFT_356640 [Sordaria brevicollis]|uniref:Ankyrin repeat protein n=1 Tax=Sordaria brevicollis TaxID=83679 RepID=A0AAE0PBA6_SORBR|nr:hypothetical protein B0T20DRAFT_356640 [Sordaria brevicollis]
MSSPGTSSSKASPGGTRIGRPPQWTVSRSRKLARLYVYTTLSIGRIIKVLEDDLFAPRKNSAQKTVHKMLDNDPRYLRPESRVEMDQRIDCLSRSTIRKRASGRVSGRPQPRDLQRRISDCSTLYAEKVCSLLDNFTIASGSDLQELQHHSSWVESSEPLEIGFDTFDVSPAPGLAVPGDFLTAHTNNCAEVPVSGHGSGTCWCAIVAETTREEGSWLTPTGEIREEVGDLVSNPSPELGCQEHLFRLVPYAGDALGLTNTAGQTFLHVLNAEWFTNIPSALSSLRRLLDVVRHFDQDIFHIADVYGRTFFHRAASLVADREVLADILTYCNVAVPLCRDAFGLDPVANVQPAPTILPPGTPIYSSPISYSPTELPNRSSTPSRLPSPSLSTAGIPSPADEGPFLAYHARLIRIIHSAYSNPLAEDSEGRNGLHCLAEAIINQQSMDEQRSAISSTSSSRPQKRSRHSSLSSEFTPIHVMQSMSPGPTSHPSPVTSVFNVVVPEKENPLPSRLRHLHSLLHPSSSSSSSSSGPSASGSGPGSSSAGVNPNAYDKSGTTPLMAFIQHIPDHDDDKSRTLQSILETLIRGGANIEARNRRGETPLLMAARLGRKTALSVLLEQGANVAARDKWGRGVLEVLDWGVLGCNGSAVGRGLQGQGPGGERLSGREEGIKEREELALYARLEACRGLLTGRRDWGVGYVRGGDEQGMGVVGEWRVKGRNEGGKWRCEVGGDWCWLEVNGYKYARQILGWL